MTKSKSSNSGSNGSSLDWSRVRMDVDERSLKGRKSYFRLPSPDVVEKGVAPLGDDNATLWFSFEQTQYYPVSILDANNNLIKRSDIHVHMELELLENKSDIGIELPPRYVSKPATPTSNIYWFTRIIPHVAGRFRLSIVSNNSLIPPTIREFEADGADLRHQTVAVASVAVTGNADTVLDVPPTKKSRKQQTISIAESKEVEPKEVIEEKEELALLASPTRKTKATAKATVAATTTATMEAAPVPPTATRNSTRYTTTVSGGLSKQQQQEMDLEVKDATKELLEMCSFFPIGITDNVVKIVRPQVSPLLLSGLGAQLRFPPELVTALLDDQARMTALQAFDQTITTTTTESESTSTTFTDHEKYVRQLQIQTKIEQYNQPSVHEILYRQQRDCRSQIADSVEIFQMIRQMFEVTFETTLLYEIEKKSPKMVTILGTTKSSKKNYSSVVGAVYLLRLLLFLAVSLASVGADAGSDDMPLTPTTPAPNASSSSSSSSSSTPNNNNSSSGSSQRRRSLTNKALAGSATKLHEVLQFIINDLARQSHYMFP